MTVTPSNSRLPLLALIAGGIAIGCSPIFVRLSEIGPVSTAFWRLALALGPLILLFSRKKQQQMPLPGPIRCAAIYWRQFPVCSWRRNWPHGTYPCI